VADSYCNCVAWFWYVSDTLVDPATLLNTSDPPRVIVTRFVLASIFFTPMRVLSAGAVGSVTVTTPLVASTGTNSFTFAE
jgi:hypothetical protein